MNRALADDRVIADESAHVGWSRRVERTEDLTGNIIEVVPRIRVEVLNVAGDITDFHVRAVISGWRIRLVAPETVDVLIVAL